MTDSIKEQLVALGCRNVEDYIDVKTHNLLWHCLDCGDEYSRSLMHQKKGTKCCTPCAKTRNTAPKKLSTAFLITEGCINPEEYINNHTANLKWVCKGCGDIYVRAYAKLTPLGSLGMCTSCTINKISLARKVDSSTLISLGCINPQEYIGVDVGNLKWYCKDCGEVYARPLSTHRVGKGTCNSCTLQNISIAKRLATPKVACVGIINSEEYINNCTSNMQYPCDSCGKVYLTTYSNITHINTSKHFCRSCLCSVSSHEIEIVEYLQEIYKGSIVTNTRKIITPKELDIYLPELNLAIELNGTYWHSSKFVERQQHYTKYLACKEKGITLLQFWDIDWVNKKELIKSMLHTQITQSNLKVFARRCSIEEIQIEDARSFLNLHHIQGFGTGASTYLGLFNLDTLISVMCFKKVQGNVYNLTRFCTIQGTTVVGGASKLLTHFIRTTQPSEIISFSDNMYSTGKLYKTLGFTYTDLISVDYKYLHKGELHHKFGYRHTHLKYKLKEYTNTLSERQNCENNGIYRVFDSGKIKWTLTL